jgi:hypothetical protein
MGVLPGNRPTVPRDWFRGVPERYVEGADIRGRREERPYPWSQQVIHEISGLALIIHESAAPVHSLPATSSGTSIALLHGG